MADVDANLKDWSTTASSNKPAGTATIGTGLDDNLREIEKVVRQDLAHKGADIASATTTDIGAVAGLMHDITGTTTITGLGTVSAGIWKVLQFDGALTLTHNGTSLILPGGANITTAAGDVGIFISEGSGNWRCLHYQRASGGILTSATQAQQETGTATTAPVTPGVQQYHPSAAKAWQLATTAGGSAIAFNCDAPTDAATGQVIINFTTDFSSVNYAVIGQGLIVAGGTNATTYTTHTSGQAAGAITLTNIRHSDFQPVDPTQWNVMAFGDQA